MPELQDTTDSFSSLLSAFSGGLFNIDCPSGIDIFPSQPVAPAGNPVATDDGDLQWEQLISAPTSAGKTAVFKIPAVPTSNNPKYTFNNCSPRTQQIGRMRSWPRINYQESETEIEEPVCFSSPPYSNGQFCYSASNDNYQQRTSSLPREGSDKTHGHRRTFSGTDLGRFFSDNQMVYGCGQSPQLLTNETFRFSEQTQPLQQNSSHTTNKHSIKDAVKRKRGGSLKSRRKTNSTHPYPHCFHIYNVSNNITIIINMLIHTLLTFPHRLNQV